MEEITAPSKTHRKAAGDAERGTPRPTGRIARALRHVLAAGGSVAAPVRESLGEDGGGEVRRQEMLPERPTAWFATEQEITHIGVVPCLIKFV